MREAKLYTDGGSRGNPGPAALGVVLHLPDETKTYHEYIGHTTNNVAEYRALQKGLALALEHDVTHIKCFLDSELVVKQLNGQYRMKNPGLRPLFLDVQKQAQSFMSITFTAIPRAQNKQADALVNKALDNAQEDKQ